MGPVPLHPAPDFPRNLLCLGQFLEGSLLRKVSPFPKLFPDSACSKESKLWWEFTPCSPSLYLFDEPGTASQECSGNRQLGLLEVNTRLSIHISLGPWIHMTAHSEAYTCPPSIPDCPRNPLSLPQLSQASLFKWGLLGTQHGHWGGHGYAWGYLHRRILAFPQACLGR